MHWRHSLLNKHDNEPKRVKPVEKHRSQKNIIKQSVTKTCIGNSSSIAMM